MLRLMMGVLLLSCATPPQEESDLAARLKDPANVWPAFQACMKEGAYANAHDLLAPATKRALVYEAFYVVFASYEAPRRMVETLKVHRAEAGKLLLCSPEFGVSREVKLTKYMGKVWKVEFTPEDIEFLKGRSLGWFRNQVKRSDGWHFAYPPDWTYAPEWRACGCGK